MAGNKLGGCLFFAVVGMIGFAVFSQFLGRGLAGAIDLFNQHPMVTIGVIIIGMVIIGIFLNQRDSRRRAEMVVEEQNRRKAEERAREAKQTIRKQQLLEEQRKIRGKMDFLTKNSIDVVEHMTKVLIESEAMLDQAESDLTENAAWPFWDVIERAATRLSETYRALDRIKKNSGEFSELLLIYIGPLRKYPITGLTVSKLNVGTETAMRMKALVQRALRNNTFASMYEQRRTNKFLAEGFANLGQALDNMSSRITTSIDNVAASVNDLSRSTKNFQENLDQRMSGIQDTLSELNDNISEYQAEQAWREKKAADMLDDIRRGRKPFTQPPPFF